SREPAETAYRDSRQCHAGDGVPAHVTVPSLTERPLPAPRIVHLRTWRTQFAASSPDGAAVFGRVIRGRRCSLGACPGLRHRANRRPDPVAPSGLRVTASHLETASAAA